jgi:Na+/pantothenate symporter
MYLFASAKGIAIPTRTDELLPLLALDHLGTFAAIVFLLGIIAATFSSADSVLTTLTTSLYIDILHLDKRPEMSAARKKKFRNFIHAGFAVVLLGVILIFRAINNDAVISGIFTAAGYTYGPLLGLFAFGILTKRQLNDKLAPFICLAAPFICYLLQLNSPNILGSYQIGIEMLILNGALTFAGLWAISQKAS